MRLQPGQTIDDRRPFTRADARVAQLELSALWGPRYLRLFHDVYVSAAARPALSVRAGAAVALNGDGAYASHGTAAELWGAVVPDQGLIHVSVPAGKPRTERQGIRAHRARALTEVRLHDGITLSSPAQTVIEMASDGVGLLDLVVAADAMVRSGCLTLKELLAAAKTWTGPGVRVARRAARFVREGVDSPMESRLRMLVLLAGLAEPEVNHILRSEDGTWRMRFDLAYPGLKIVVEYDGLQHRDSEGQWKRDVQRREELDRLGWRLLIVHSDGIYDDPGATLDRIADLLRERGAERVRRTYKPEWRRFFPGRG